MWLRMLPTLAPVEGGCVRFAGGVVVGGGKGGGGTWEGSGELLILFGLDVAALG